MPIESEGLNVRRKLSTRPQSLRLVTVHSSVRVSRARLADSWVYSFDLLAAFRSMVSSVACGLFYSCCLWIGYSVAALKGDSRTSSHGNRQEILARLDGIAERHDTGEGVGVGRGAVRVNDRSLNRLGAEGVYSAEGE